MSLKPRDQAICIFITWSRDSSRLLSQSILYQKLIIWGFYGSSGYPNTVICYVLVKYIPILFKCDCITKIHSNTWDRLETKKAWKWWFQLKKEHLWKKLSLFCLVILNIHVVVYYFKIWICRFMSKFRCISKSKTRHLTIFNYFPIHYNVLNGPLHFKSLT